MARFALWALLAASLGMTGCDDDKGADEDDDDGSFFDDTGGGDGGDDGGDDGGTGDFSPYEGDWEAVDGDILTDTCGFSDDPDTGGSDGDPLTLTMTGEATFTLGDDSGETGAVMFTCTLSGKDFSCDPESDVTDYSSSGLNAELTVTQTMAGSFSSSTEMRADYSLLVECAGPDCGTLATYAGLDIPCEVVGYIDAVAVEI